MSVQPVDMHRQELNRSYCDAYVAPATCCGVAPVEGVEQLSSTVIPAPTSLAHVPQLKNVYSALLQ